MFYFWSSSRETPKILETKKKLEIHILEESGKRKTYMQDTRFIVSQRQPKNWKIPY